MNKIYNNLKSIINSFRNFFSDFSNSKTLLNFIPLLFCPIINSESITTSKVALDLFTTFNDFIRLDSHSKRIYRFLHNPNYNIHNIFNDIVII